MPLLQKTLYPKAQRPSNLRKDRVLQSTQVAAHEEILQKDDTVALSPPDGEIFWWVGQEYTLQDLILKHFDTPLHTKYAKIYNRLDKKEIAIKKDLGCLAKDPCPIHLFSGCYKCTGYYKIKTRKFKYIKAHKTRFYCVMTKKNEKSAIKCEYKIFFIYKLR